MKLTTLFVIMLALTVICPVFVAADWKILSDETTSKIKTSTVNQTKIEITVPPYETKKIKVNGKDCIVIYMADASMYMQQGFPMVPKLTKLVKLQERCDVKLQVLSKEEVEVDLEAPIVPSKGHFTREIPYESVPFEFGPIYHENVFWPSDKEQITLGEAFTFRDVHGVRVQILPIRANHVTMKMKVIKKLVIALICDGVSNKLMAAPTVRPSKTFRTLYTESVLGATEATSDRGTVPPENNRKLVVVTPAEFEGQLANWVNWKKQSGYQVTVNVVAAGTTAGTIKAYLQGLYDNTATRFGYVVLIGDAGYTSNFEQATPMPTFKGSYEGAAADRVYVRLAGSDNYPDAFISRISGNASQIADQLNKIMSYEQNPPAGDWYNKGVCIASNQGSPTDKERAEWLQNGGGTGQKVPVDAGGLIKFGISAFDDIYDPSASVSMVANAVNSGRTIICYIGHGSSTSWGSSQFSVSDVRNLSNGGMLPVIWSVACVNGDFVRTGECFAEAWLRKANGGAIAMEAASTNEAWVPPCDKQCATVNAIIRRSHTTFGALEAVGCIKGLEVWGDANNGQGNQMAEQCNLFGDCTTLVRTRPAQILNVQASRGMENATFQITSEGRAMANMTVTLYTQDLSVAVSTDSDEAGNVNVSLASFPANTPLLYTVVGADMIPVIDSPLN